MKNDITEQEVELSRESLGEAERREYERSEYEA